jgi:hypothetical protein
MSTTFDPNTVLPLRVRALTWQVMAGADALARLHADPEDNAATLGSLVTCLKESEDEISITLASRMLGVDKKVVRAWKNRGVLEGSGKGVTLWALTKMLDNVNFIRESLLTDPTLLDQLADRQTRLDLKDRLAALERGETVEIDMDKLDELFS